jgi:predicted GIY-YIG superfamily endonuclease
VDFYVYILKCSDDSYYVGHTDDIEKRIDEHVSGACKGYVSTRLPITVMFVEPCASRAEALEAERKLKGWSRWKKELLIEFGWEGMKHHKRRYKKGSSTLQLGPKASDQDERDKDFTG